MLDPNLAMRQQHHRTAKREFGELLPIGRYLTGYIEDVTNVRLGQTRVSWSAIRFIHQAQVASPCPMTRGRIYPTFMLQGNKYHKDVNQLLAVSSPACAVPVLLLSFNLTYHSL
jgi:hypothetical protein